MLPFGNKFEGKVRLYLASTILTGTKSMLRFSFQEPEKRPLSKDSLAASCTLSTAVTPDSLNNFATGNSSGDNNGYSDVLNALKRLETEEQDIAVGKSQGPKSGGSPNLRCSTAGSSKSSSERISALHSYLDEVENGVSEGASATGTSHVDGNEAVGAITKGDKW